MPHSMGPSIPLIHHWPPFPACSQGFFPAVPKALESEVSPETVQKLRRPLEAAWCCVSIRIPADKGFAVDRAELLAAGGRLNKANILPDSQSRPRQQEYSVCVRVCLCVCVFKQAHQPRQTEHNRLASAQFSKIGCFP